MTILFGHPAGNPNAHHAALAHYEAGRLEAACIPWMPRPGTLRMLASIPGLRPAAGRLARRSFEPLASAPLIQGRMGEMRRMLMRVVGRADEGLAYEANDWLMRRMRREVGRPAVTAVHSYEDCSLWQFERAKSLGKACVYDMPIGYFPAWERTRDVLLARYGDWVADGGLASSRYARPLQKRREMELADLVLVPGSFVERTILDDLPGKRLARAAYGVDTAFWSPSPARRESTGPLCFLYAGQLSIRKGLPLLLQAWSAASLRDATLELVGVWQLARSRRDALPANVVVRGPLSSPQLRERYRAADVFVFPSFFEGFGLVLLEAMACGLPAIATRATAAPDVVASDSGLVIDTGDEEQLVEALRWFAHNRERVDAMRVRARAVARACTWDAYRRAVSAAVAPFAP